MSYEVLSLSSFIKEMKEVTTGTHPRKFCFVLGAGASRTSGIKSGQDLVKIWDKELRERNFDEYNHWRESLNITDDNLFAFYSQYYEKRFNRCPSDGYNYIEKIMELAKPSAGYVMLAHILTKHPHKVVITTNFDHLTEDAVNYYAQETPLVIGHESLSHYISANPMRPTIIKIHRDLLFDPKSRTEDLEKLPDNWKSSLGIIFENYHPIFIGYAGNDNSLMDFLIENAQKFANDEWKYPYWMLYEGDKLEGKTLEFISKTDGYIIHHAGFDDVMIQIGVAFDYQTPTEEDFLKDAKKRYKSLADAIDAFSDKYKKSEVVVENTSKSIELVDENNGSNDGMVAIEKIASQSEIQQQYRQANIEMENGNYEKSSELLLELIEREPDNVRYIRSYGIVLFQQKKWDDALIQFDKALNIEPQNEPLYFWRGMVFEKMKKYEEALLSYNMALGLKPEDDMNHLQVGRMLEKLERYEEALEQYNIAVELEPNDAINHFSVGNILETLERYEEALEKYSIAVTLEPSTAINHFKVGNILEKLERYEEALEQYRIAVELEPRDAFYHFKVGNILEELGEFDNALSEFSIANELEIKVFHYLAAGNVLEKLERNEEAITQYKSALELDEKMDICYWKLATLYNKMEKHEKALTNIKKAIDVDDTFGGYYETMASILINLGKNEEAKIAIEKASSLKNTSKL